MWLDVICVNISICTFIPLCNFDMRPYLQLNKFGVIFKAAFESRPRRSPDMDEAPEKKHGVRVGAGGFVSDFSMEMFDEGVWCPAAMVFSTRSLLLQKRLDDSWLCAT